MKVEIRKQAVDEATGEVTIQTVEGDNEEEVKRRLARGYIAPPKQTAFTMFQHFRNTVQYVNIEGTLHVFDPQKGYYQPVDQSGLEEILLDKYYDVVERSGSLRIVKTCAELIMKKKPCEALSAEKQMLLCFQKGFLPIGNMEYTYFMPYNPQTPVYPTYLINASGYSNMSDWNGMKNLDTPYMSEFLASISMGNQKIEERIWQMIGYLLTPDTNGKCFFILQGTPNCGKSVLGNFLKTLLSDHRIASLDIDQLGKKNATSQLVNKSINISMDLPNKILSPLAIRNIKLMTGNDDITVEYSNGKLEKNHSNCKFLFATNHPLVLRGTDTGFEERIVCIPFRRSIPAAERNYNLVNDLLREKDIIVAKALAYYRDLRLNNYIFSGSELEVCKVKTRYLPTEAEDMDANLCQFVEERCEFAPMDYGTFTEELYSAYRSFCKEQGETPIDNMASFSRRLLRCYGSELRKKKWRRRGETEPRWGFLGIAIQPMRPVREDGAYNV